METMDLLKQLEINYKLISNDLDFASHKLDAHLTAASRADSSVPDLRALQTRIQALQTAMPGLVADAAHVVRERKAVEPALNATLLETYNIMVRLYARLGVAPDPDWVAIAEDTAGLAPESRDSFEAESGGVGCERQGQKQQLTEGPTGTETNAGEPEAKRVEDVKPRPTPSGVIFEEDFLAVASNTRGRCKLEDVRKVYAKVREDYQEKSTRGRHSSKPEPITKKQLDATGVKVFGLTGDSILNTLRALGLVTSSHRTYYRND